MASRWMEQKRQRIKAYRVKMQGLHTPFAIKDKVGREAVRMPDPPKGEDRALVEAYSGKITVGACTGEMPREAYSVTGKKKARRYTDGCSGGKRIVHRGVLGLCDGVPATWAIVKR
jgi:hypothetical protein